MSEPAQIFRRVRVLVIGGGIHGVGVLHDLATRGWKDILLVEKGSLGCGTSSRSTKLIHGGLRYLSQIRDFGLVTEALRERKTLMTVAPDLVRPIELALPILKTGGLSSLKVKTGLVLYDLLSGRKNLAKHKNLKPKRLEEAAPILDCSYFKKVYSYMDAQTDDMGLVQRIGDSAQRLGASYLECHRVISILRDHNGWLVTVKPDSGPMKTLSALYLVNAAGPWSNELLLRNKLEPTHRAMNNRGAHLLLPDLGLKMGLLLQTRSDGRIFFLLPWEGYTLLGTTEEIYGGNPDDQQPKNEDVDYLLTNINQYLKKDLVQTQIVSTFSGLRWLAMEQNRSLTDTSRNAALGEIQNGRGLLITIYGGKLTTYRALSEKIGDRIITDFGESRATRTFDPEAWLPPPSRPNGGNDKEKALGIPGRFQKQQRAKQA